MNKLFLIINAGSSSLKFSLCSMPEQKEIVNGYVEKIGNPDSFYTLKFNGEKIEKNKIIMNHNEAVQTMINELLENKFINDVNEIKGIGHRVLHGGEIYNDSVIIDNKVLNDIVSLTKLGPLHHPGQIAGIKAMLESLPNATQVAVFDTAFHQTMPKENYIYATPYEWYTKYGVRKYGFHGTSHKYITEYMKKELNKDNVNLIVCHVGSGASISCIKDGICHNTTMGLTPLDGLVMGTRSGNIDASIIKYIMEETGKNIEEVTNDLNKNSGLIGICGKNDFRDLLVLKNNGNELGELAYKIFLNSIVKFIGEYYFELDGEVDAIIFTAGVLENNVLLREDIINKISKPMNIYLDKETNDSIARFKEKQEGIISTPNSKTKVIVMPTNEEIMILKDTYTLYQQSKGYSKVLKK